MSSPNDGLPGCYYCGVPQKNYIDYSAPPQKNYQSFSRNVLLVAVVCLALVVACVTFLHLYIQWVIRHRSPARVSSFSLPSSAPRPGTKRGLDTAALVAIPTFPYAAAAGEAADCTVCLSPVVDGELVREFPACRHVFHEGCVDMWLHSHSTCPVCRAEAEPQPREGESPVPVADAAVEVDCGETSGGGRPLRLGSLRRMLSRERTPGEDLERQ